MTTELADIKGGNEDLFFKPLDFQIFAKIAEPDDVEITQIWNPTDGLVIPDGYLPVGYLDKGDGATWPDELTIKDHESAGEDEPTRRDSEKRIRGVQFTAQESSARILGFVHQMDLSDLQGDEHNNVVITPRNKPRLIDYRFFGLAQDGDGADARYLLKWLTRTNMTEPPEGKWDDGEISAYGLKFDGKKDPTFGFAYREIWGGPGFDPVAAGFKAHTP